MTNNQELVAEVRRRRTDHPTQTSDGPLIDRLADALESAEKEKAEAWRVASEQTRMERDRAEAAEMRAELADADLDVELDKNAGYRKRNDQLAAVVEKVRAWADEAMGYGEPSGDTVSDLLATAPADALREHDAQVRAETLREAHADFQAYTDAGAPHGHRPVEEFLLRRADRIEKEQDRG